MLATGYILWFALPPGTNKVLSLWEPDPTPVGRRPRLDELRPAGRPVRPPLWLHWQWLASVVRKRLHLPGSSHHGGLRSGLTTFLVVGACLGLFAWATHSGVQEISDPTLRGVCPPGEEGTEKNVAATPSPPSVLKQEGPTAPEFWQDVYPVLERSCLSYTRQSSGGGLSRGPARRLLRHGRQGGISPAR